jgi:hypothetical protein
MLVSVNGNGLVVIRDTISLEGDVLLSRGQPAARHASRPPVDKAYCVPKTAKFQRDLQVQQLQGVGNRQRAQPGLYCEASNRSINQH